MRTWLNHVKEDVLRIAGSEQPEEDEGCYSSRVAIKMIYVDVCVCVSMWVCVSMLSVITLL